MISDADVRKGLPGVIQDACHLMLKDTFFQHVLNELEKVPNYILVVYLNEWREDETRNILVGAFCCREFYTRNFEIGEEEFKRNIHNGLPQIAVSRKDYWQVSRNIGRCLAESYASETLPNYWAYVDKEYEERLKPKKKMNEEKPKMSKEEFQKFIDEIDWDALRSNLKKQKVPQTPVTELGFERVREVFRNWADVFDDEGNLRLDHFDYYLEFHGICTDIETSTQYNQFILGCDCDETDAGLIQSHETKQQKTFLIGLEEEEWFESLEQESKMAIRSSEELYYGLRDKAVGEYDLSPIIFGYLKGIEIELKRMFEYWEPQILGNMRKCHKLQTDTPKWLERLLNFYKSKSQYPDNIPKYQQSLDIIRHLGAGYKLPPGMAGFFPDDIRQYILKEHRTLKRIEIAFRKRNDLAHTGVISSEDHSNWQLLESDRTEARILLAFLVDLK